MITLIKAFGILIIVLSLWGLVFPEKLAGNVTSTVRKPWGPGFAVIVRVALGALFIVAAPQTGNPVIFKILGYLMLVAAVLILVLGRDRLARMTAYIAGRGASTLRAWLLLGLAFGAAVFWLA